MMNYSETKEFQDFVIFKCDDVIDTIREILSRTRIHSCWSYISSSLAFRSLCNKLIISTRFDSCVVSNITLNADSLTDYDGDVDKFYDDLKLENVKLNLVYKGNHYGIDIRLNLELADMFPSYYNNRYYILGSVIDFFSTYYQDTNYDIRFFPTTLSRNPNFVTFLDDLYGHMEVYEYLNLHNFEFDKDYNKWTEEEYTIQKLSLS